MTNIPAKTADSANLTEQEQSLIEAYTQSASQDKKIAAEFDATLADGLFNVQVTPKAHMQRGDVYQVNLNFSKCARSTHALQRSTWSACPGASTGGLMVKIDTALRLHLAL